MIHFHIGYLLTYLSTYLSTYLPVYLPTYLPTCLPTCLSTYLPTYFFFRIVGNFLIPIAYLVTRSASLASPHPETQALEPDFCNSDFSDLTEFQSQGVNDQEESKSKDVCDLKDFRSNDENPSREPKAPSDHGLGDNTSTETISELERPGNFRSDFGYNEAASKYDDVDEAANNDDVDEAASNDDVNEAANDDDDDSTCDSFNSNSTHLSIQYKASST